MKNKDQIIEKLNSSKKFVAINKSDTTTDKAENIQALLSEAIHAATQLDEDKLKENLNEIDHHAVPGWSITQDIYDLLK